MNIVPNYDQALDQIKPDDYHVRVKSCDEHVSKKGTKCLRWMLHIIGGEYHGRPLYLTTPTEGKGAGFLRQFLQSVDPRYVDGGFEVDGMLGKEVFVRVLDNKALHGDRSYLKIIPIRGPSLVKNGEMESVQEGGVQ